LEVLLAALLLSFFFCSSDCANCVSLWARYLYLRLVLENNILINLKFNFFTCISSFTSVKNELLPSHPLELAEKNFQLNQDKTNFATLRNIQGLHAPLKLQMEFRAVKQAQRLPFLHSSNIALDTLRGNDECIGFEDILNDPSQSEVMGEPHMMMEYKLGLL
uniref:Proteasome maturation protein n=1 Tax=Accipiter nisus TaxID=211598 RepID=A0A8B9RPY2_9AVES